MPQYNHLKSDLSLAFIRYVRTWLHFDGAMLKAVSRSNGLTEQLVQQIAIEYSVMRGIRSRDGARKLARLLNRRIVKWPSEDLLGRANFCAELANEVQYYTYGNQVSAISKLIWFLKPNGWTPFDRSASAGLVKMTGNGSRFSSFYSTLYQHGFVSVSWEMQKYIPGSFAGISALRVLDVYLMRKGNRFNNQLFVDDQIDFLSLFPSDSREEIGSIAETLQQKFGKRVEALSVSGTPA